MAETRLFDFCLKIDHLECVRSYHRPHCLETVEPIGISDIFRNHQCFRFCSMPPLKIAKVIEWNLDRGFGFLSDDEGNERTFLHIKELVGGARPPMVGDRIAYSLGADPQGRPQAVKATNLRRGVSLTWRNWLLLAFLLILPVMGMLRIEQPIGSYWLMALMVAASVTSYLLSSQDKRLAETGGWRISEMRLHVLELIGGWPGAFIAQKRFRHKCNKGAYQFVFWIIVIGHQIVAIDIFRGGEVSYTTWKLLRSLFSVAIDSRPYQLMG